MNKYTPSIGFTDKKIIMSLIIIDHKIPLKTDGPFKGISNLTLVKIFQFRGQY